MNATIQQLHRDRGTGSLLGEDGKTYMFRRNAVRDGWFHDLKEGAAVTFDPAEPPGKLEATCVRLVRQTPST
jgi:cold shock CspA family protein